MTNKIDNSIKSNRGKLLIVDGSSLLSTGFYATAQPLMFAKTEEQKLEAYDKLMKSPDGQYTNGIYMFFKTLLGMIEKHNYTHLAVVLDRSRKTTFRRQLFSEYKGTRKATPSPLSDQFKLLTEVLQEIDIPVFSHEEYEADDFAGSLAVKFEEEIPCYLHSKDMDYLQLVSENTFLLMPTSKSDDMYSEVGFTKEEIDMFNIPKGTFMYTPMYVKHFHGVEPIQIIDLKAIEGDKSDNIPGVAGVGPKASIPLLNEFGTIENIYNEIDDLDEKEQKALAKFFKDSLGISRSPIKNLLANRDSAFLSKQLATIKTDIEEVHSLSLNDLTLNINKEKSNEIFTKLGMKSLVGTIK